MAAGKLVNGRVGAGLLLLALFTLLGFVVARLALRTVVHARGFVLRGFQEFEWTEILRATVLSDRLRMELRNGGSAELPQLVLEDRGFRVAICGWLAAEHPVRRAISR